MLRFVVRIFYNGFSRSTQFGPVTVFVNSAGVGNVKPAIELNKPNGAKILDANLTGTWQMAQACARRMLAAQASGSIVKIPSIGGLRQNEGTLPYSLSKAGIVQLTQCLALEWARRGIRVHAIAPGFFKKNPNAAFLDSDAGQAAVRRASQRSPGQMHELDGPLLLLASEAGAFMTGSVVAIDGGYLVSSL
ncbi:SDR family NAD(P)-dependent oxidoreductase [Methylobacterium sp. J-070]|uniref:SDR family NAD(P)-dependent oxidoreductase n=1 Tax=Methylobacterium sp. J-070 TaxID=2836650 RepID=UPI001FB9BE62|nr:SDR family oxidoreductase [Methylobacterium sp. J-070]MCJ2048931.1 SDR family oxidoreductase [Methylobacterium sp. J-070]